MKINPVYKKELKISVRSIKIAFTLLGYNLILALIGLVAFYLTFEGNGYVSTNYSDILNIYLTISVIEIALVLFLVPAFTAGAISGERERQTLEMLLTTQLRPIQIILGKLSSCISTILLLVISSLPVLSIVFAVGGIQILDLIQLIFLAFVTAIFIGSIGLFFSTLFKKTVPATVFTYGTVIFLILGTIFIVVVTYMMISMNIENQYTGTGTMKEADIGYLLLIFLVNPAITLISMVTKQYGSTAFVENMFTEFGTINPFIMEHWFVISIIVQLVISGILILLTARLLDPLKRRK
jgi:ABC-type transport system involved in multi-copper enzyme maturation permease subunit